MKGKKLSLIVKSLLLVLAVATIIGVNSGKSYDPEPKGSNTIEIIYRA
jgi:hypothetical protein